jgi:hypothetical protein
LGDAGNGSRDGEGHTGGKQGADRAVEEDPVLSQEIWDSTDGLGVLQSLIAGDLPAPPIAHFCGIVPVEAEAGRTTWRMPASEWLCAPIQGRLYGGAIAMLAGTAIDGAVQTTLRP